MSIVGTETEAPQAYVLTIAYAGPGFRDQLEIIATNLNDFEPEYVEQGGYVYERYRGDDTNDWTEVRLDFIFKRSLMPLPDQVRDDEEIGAAAAADREDDDTRRGPS